MDSPFLQRFLKVIPIILCLTACAQADKQYSEILASGDLSSSEYSNSFFKFKIKFPEKWVILSKEETARRNRMGREMLKADSLIDDNTNTDPRFLFNIDKYRQDAIEAINESAGFQISFLKKKYLSASNGREFLEHARKLVANKDFYKMIGGIDNIKIGGKDFATSKAELHIKGFTIYQRNFIANINDCLFIIDMSWRGKGDLHLKNVEQELNNILQSLTFQ